MIATFFVPLEKPWKEDGWQYVRAAGTYRDSGDLSPIPSYFWQQADELKHYIMLMIWKIARRACMYSESHNELKVFLKDDSYFHYATRISVNDLWCDTT